MTNTSFALTAEERVAGSARQTKKAGKVPGVVYGHKFVSLPISINYSDMLKAYRQAGKSSLVELHLGKKKVPALIHDINLHPVKRTIEHVDFYAVNIKEETDVHVPFEFTGTAPAVKNKGGILVHEHETLYVRCLPTEIPHSIEVSLESLEDLHDTITLAQIAFDRKTLEVLDLEENTVIATVLAPRIIEEEPSEAPKTVEVPAEHGADDEKSEA